MDADTGSLAEKRLSVSDDDDESDSRSEEISVTATADSSPALPAKRTHGQRLNLGQLLSPLISRIGSIKHQSNNNNLFVVATVALVLLFLSAAFLLHRANFLYSRLTDLTTDTHLLSTG